MRRAIEVAAVLLLGSSVFVLRAVTEPGPLRASLQLACLAVVCVLAFRSLRRLSKAPANGGRGPASPGRGSPQPVGRWEDVDPLGDEDRLAGIRKWLYRLGSVAGVSLVLVVVGDKTLRVLGAVSLAFCIVMIIPLVQSALSSRKRIREGKGLVPGDPYRPEGISRSSREEGYPDQGSSA